MGSIPVADAKKGTHYVLILYVKIPDYVEDFFLFNLIKLAPSKACDGT